jgi:NADH-quinone oxidoreductase subunit G
MWEAHPILAEVDVVTRAPWVAFGEAGPVARGPFAYPIEDFYRTDPISRASETMAQCSELFVARRYQGSARTGTYG